MITVNQRDRVKWRPGMTVQDILDEMGYDYALITVTVNDRLIPEDDYETHLIEDGESVTVFHLAHGG
ncbi:MAG: sulfur carrier protein ThiS [Candidatus Krumholzibacteriota bacterium]|nr:sulfur carrier protein ThiS [Candidatus Krumholzibacteriota bacterium]